MFEVLLKILHPFVPFITEEIWHLLKERPQGFSIMFERCPSVKPLDHEKLYLFEQVKEIVTFIRNARVDNQIPNKNKLTLFVKPVSYKGDFNPVIIKQGNLEEMIMTSEKPDDAVSLMTAYAEFYIPLGDYHHHEEELAKLQKELEYIRGFLDSVMKKLNNESFAGHAPAKVIELENRKKTDAELKIKALESQIATLKK
jgi:valyl-tRNA synthetase